MTAFNHDHIVMTGAGENNLKNVSLRIPEQPLLIWNGGLEQLII